MLFRSQVTAKVMPDVLLLHGEKGARDVIATVRAWTPGVRIVVMASDPSAEDVGCEVVDAATDPSLLREILGVLPGSPSHCLTAREVDVLRLAAEGLANRAISARLGITENTVKNHLRHVHRKLDVRSRTEAIVAAARSGYPVIRLS